MGYYGGQFFGGRYYAGSYYRGAAAPVPVAPSFNGGAGSIGSIVFTQRKKKRPNIAYDPTMIGFGEIMVPASLIADDVLKKAKLKRKKRSKRIEHEEALLYNDFDLIAAELRITRR